MRGVIFLLSLVLVVFSCKDNGSDRSPSGASPAPTSTPNDDDDSSLSSGKNEGEDEDGSEDDTNSLPSIQLVAGVFYNCALQHSSGKVKCWGQGKSAQLGQPSKSNIGDEPDEMGKNLNTVKLGGGRTAKAVSVGSGHTCVILDDDTVKCWGDGENGKLGYGNEDLIGDTAGKLESVDPVNLGNGRTAKAIALGWGHTCAILNDDSVTCWGSGSYGKLGNGKTDDIGDGENEMGDSLTTIDFGDNRTAKAISAGHMHTCAILSDDSLKCWGGGADGVLGQDNTDSIGDKVNEVRDAPEVDLGNGHTAKAISVGSGHTCVILDDDTVKCWGHNSDGRLGYDNKINSAYSKMGDKLPAVNLGTGRTAKAISAGATLTCAILDDDTAKCWGSGSNGQLGVGNKDNLGDSSGEMEKLQAINFGEGRTVKSIAAGGFHACALLDSNSVKCWGLGSYGQLGNGKTNKLGDSENETVDKLPTVDLGF